MSFNLTQAAGESGFPQGENVRIEVCGSRKTSSEKY